MTTTTPTIMWKSFGMLPGRIFRATVYTMGSQSVAYPLELLVNGGSNEFQIVTGTLSDLRPGMVIIPSLEIAPPTGLPNGLSITEVNDSGYLLLGGGLSPWLTGSETPNGWVYTQPASNTISPACSAIDQYPYGYLAVTTTPSTGVTIKDWGFDGSGSDNHIGNGQQMCNSGGQAMGTFEVTFADAGSYEVAVAFTSYDADYGNASTSMPVLVS